MQDTDTRLPRACPVSDHFDGRRFFNPTLPNDTVQTRGSVLKMLFQQRRLRSPWPKQVENTSTPDLDAPRGDGDVAITFVGHATFLIQFGEFAILTDPFWSDRASPVTWAGPRRVRKPGIAFDALPRIDVVLLSHNHYDHLDLATLKRLRDAFSPAILFAAGDSRLIGPLGFKTARELDWWDPVMFDDGLKITFVPAQHFSARGPFDRCRSLWGGYMIERHGRRIYFCGDSGYSTHFAAIKARLGAPDLALLPIGAYEPRWFMQPVHMNPAEAVQAHLDLGAKRSIGMHFGTIQLTMELIERPLLDLKAALDANAVSEQAFTALDVGATRIEHMPPQAALQSGIHQLR